MGKKMWLSLSALVLALVLVGVALLALGYTAPVQATVLHDSPDAATGSTVQTWTHTTRADWRQGLLEWMDSSTISGSLQLVQQLFGESDTVTPPEDLASAQERPAIAVDAAGNAYAVWTDGRDGDSDIYFAYRAAVSTTWSASVKVNDDVGAAWQLYPDIAVDASGNAYALWHDERNGHHDVYFAYRPAGGSWGSNVRVTDNQGTAEVAGMSGSSKSHSAIAVDGAGNAYAIWHDERNGHGDIYFAYRPAGGSWGSNVRVNDDAGSATQHCPDIAVDASGNAYAVWADGRNDVPHAFWLDTWSNDDDIYFAYRPAGGSWKANVKVSDDTDASRQTRPHIAVQATGDAYAIWADRRDDNYNVYSAYRGAISTTWSANVKVSDETSGMLSRYCDIAVDVSGNVYAVWTDERNGNNDIYSAYRAAISTTWSTNVRVNDDAGTASQTSPDIAVDASGDAHVVWSDYRNGNPDVFYATCPAGGTWGANGQASDEVAGGIWPSQPRIAVDASGNAYTVWIDGRNGDWDIYSAYRAAISTTWSTSVKVNDDTGSAQQVQPHIVVNATGDAYAIWADERNGDRDLYSARRPAGGDWEANVRVNDIAGTVRGCQIGIAVDASGDTYAMWADTRNGDVDVYFAHRAAISTTWSADVKVNDDTGTENQYEPSIDVDDAGNLYAMWKDERSGGNEDVYFAYRAATSTTWGANIRVNDDGGTSGQGRPVIRVDSGGNAYAVWWDLRNGDMDTYFAYRPAGGSWGANVQVNDDAGSANQLGHQMAVDASGNAYAVWGDDRSGSHDIYSAYRPAGGSWGLNVRVNDDAGTGWQIIPSIGLDGDGNAYVVWQDRTALSQGSVIRFARSVAAPEYAPQGTYTSPEMNTATTAAAWESLSWQGTAPAGTSLTFETRSRGAGQPWSEWQPVDGSIASPPAQYLQYRVTFSTSLTDTTPRLDEVQISYGSPGTPSAPHFATPCGVTNQTTPTLRGSATAGSVVHLYADGSKVATATADIDGAFSFSATLSAGSHEITATAENDSGVGPASVGLGLVVSPTLAYDPINVRTGQWSKDGWLMSAPRDAEKCANPDDGWYIWPRANQQLRVEVPISYTTSAAVTVTVGTVTATLTEESSGLFVGVFQPPIEGGDFIIEVSSDGATTLVVGVVLIDPDGYVYEAGGTISDTVTGAQVTCYYSDSHSGQWVVWDAWNYGQVNAQMTLGDGYYSFYTPPGTYRVVAEKAGYETYTSSDLVVVNAPVRHNIPLEQKKDRVRYLPLVLHSYP